MFQAAAAFGAGVFAQSFQPRCSQAPSCTAAKEAGCPPCKLSVHVHAATVPELGEPRQMVQVKFRLRASIAGLSKETEEADFEGVSTEAAKARRRAPALPRARSPAVPTAADAQSSTWRFGDTLTFPVRPGDLLNGGLMLQLRMQSGVRLGPWQVEMPHSAQDFGEAVVDIRHRVLPSCVPSRCPQPVGCAWGPGRAPPGWASEDWRPDPECEVERPPLWESPALALPLMRVSRCPHSGVEVAVVARIVVSFSLGSDPAVLLKDIEDAERPLAHLLAARMSSCFTPLAACGTDAGADKHAAGSAVGSTGSGACRSYEALEEVETETAMRIIRL